MGDGWICVVAHLLVLPVVGLPLLLPKEIFPVNVGHSMFCGISRERNGGCFWAGTLRGLHRVFRNNHTV